MSSRSGVSLEDACVTKFEQLKLGKKIKYIIYGLNQNNTQIVVLKDSSEDDLGTDAHANYQKFLEQLPENDCRWAIYDFEFTVADGARNKICFFSWTPEGSPVKKRMVSASSKEALRRALAGVAVEIQGTDYDEVDYETVLGKCSKSR